MGKNILMLAGSPRAGSNSLLLADTFTDAARAAGHEVTVVELARLDIHACLACERCWSKGKPCVQLDDMQTIYPLLNLADVVVFATPLYFFGFSAQLKTAIDRFYPLCKDDKFPAFTDKQTALLMCGASEDEEDYDGAIRHYELLCDYLSWEDCGVVAACGCAESGSVKATPFLDQAREIAAHL